MLDGAESPTVQGDDDGLEWLDLWGVERSSLPEWFTGWKAKDNAVKNKIRQVVREEWDYMGDRDTTMKGEGGGRSVPKESGLPPPGPPLLDKSGRFFDMGSYVMESTAFPFVLMESFWTYSDPKLDAATAGEGNDDGNL